MSLHGQVGAIARFWRRVAQPLPPGHQRYSVAPPTPAAGLQLTDADVREFSQLSEQLSGQRLSESVIRERATAWLLLVHAVGSAPMTEEGGDHGIVSA